MYQINKSAQRAESDKRKELLGREESKDDRSQLKSQAKVGEVKNQMEKNLQALNERGDQIEQLQDKRYVFKISRFIFY